MIYIVEDDSAIRELEQYALQSNGYEAVTTHTTWTTASFNPHF